MLPTEQTEQPTPEQGGGGDMAPMLIKIIQKTMQAAQANGLSFDDLVMQAKNSGTSPTADQMPTPRAPSPASMTA